MGLLSEDVGFCVMLCVQIFIFTSADRNTITRILNMYESACRMFDFSCLQNTNYFQSDLIIQYRLNSTY